VVVYVLAALMWSGFLGILFSGAPSDPTHKHVYANPLIDALAGLLFLSSPFALLGALALFGYRSRRAIAAREAATAAGFKVLPGRFLLIASYVVYALLVFVVCTFIVLVVWVPADQDKHAFRDFLAIFVAVGWMPVGIAAIALFNHCPPPALIAGLEAIAARKKGTREARKQRRSGLRRDGKR